MPVLLQITTQAHDPFARAVIEEERKHSEVELRKFDLTESAPNYDRLLEEIFRADAVHIW